MGIIQLCPYCEKPAYFPGHKRYCKVINKDKQEVDPQYEEWKEIVFQQEQAYYY